MFKTISVLGGQDKDGTPEIIRRLEIRAGEVLAIVGPTGSGKTQLISDIEQSADGETLTGRSLLVDGVPIETAGTCRESRYLMAEVSQKMNFVIDATVEDFVLKHAAVRMSGDPQRVPDAVLSAANRLAGEPIALAQNLTVLSGGQARALMVADIALVSNAPIVLIDEIENAGIDRLKALEILTGRGKAVLVVTHDPTLTLMADRRVVMRNGAMSAVHRTTPDEKAVAAQLLALERDVSWLRELIRNGECLSEESSYKEASSIWQEFCCTARLTSAALCKK